MSVTRDLQPFKSFNLDPCLLHHPAHPSPRQIRLGHFYQPDFTQDLNLWSVPTQKHHWPLSPTLPPLDLSEDSLEPSARHYY